MDGLCTRLPFTSPTSQTKKVSFRYLRYCLPCWFSEAVPIQDERVCRRPCPISSSSIESTARGAPTWTLLFSSAFVRHRDPARANKPYFNRPTPAPHQTATRPYTATTNATGQAAAAAASCCVWH